MFNKNDASKFFGSRRFRVIFWVVGPKSICGPLAYTFTPSVILKATEKLSWETL